MWEFFFLSVVFFFFRNVQAPDTSYVYAAATAAYNTYPHSNVLVNYYSFNTVSVYSIAFFLILLVKQIKLRSVEHIAHTNTKQ